MKRAAYIHDDKVHILMAVYQGEAFLPDQIASFKTQTHADWHLWASVDTPDQGCDHSRDIIEKALPLAHIIDGPGEGPAANFMALMREAPAGAVWALSDQDDVWLPEKLARALSQLNAGDPDVPTLYCARTWITDEGLNGRRLSPPRPRPPSFRNALVQNIAGGNTIVMNAAATRLVSGLAQITGTPVIHDWWLYQVITGAGGVVIHDDEPVLLYRQHGDNSIGANDGWAARRMRVGLVWRGVWRDWMDRNAALLRGIDHALSPASRVTFNQFETARASGLIGRITGLKRSGVYRQSFGAAAVMWLAIIFRRL